MDVDWMWWTVRIEMEWKDASGIGMENDDVGMRRVMVRLMRSLHQCLATSAQP